MLCFPEMTGRFDPVAAPVLGSDCREAVQGGLTEPIITEGSVEERYPQIVSVKLRKTKLDSRELKLLGLMKLG